MQLHQVLYMQDLSWPTAGEVDMYSSSVLCGLPAQASSEGHAGTKPSTCSRHDGALDCAWIKLLTFCRFRHLRTAQADAGGGAQRH